MKNSTNLTARKIYRPTNKENRVIIAVNPNAGAKQQNNPVEALVAHLNRAGMHTEIKTDLDEVVQAAHEAFDHGELRVIVGAGGDGTIAELLNRVQPGVPLIMLPLGTENLLAKYLRIHGKPNEIVTKVADCILHGVVVRLDAAAANGRLFMLMISCGVDAEVIQRLHENRTGHINHLSYFKPSLATALNYKYPTLQITCYDTPDQEKPISTYTAKWAHAVNLPCYALGLKFAKRACGTDQQLDLCLFRYGGFCNTIRYFLETVLQIHPIFPDCQMAKASRIRIESDQPVPYQIDGDPGGMLPLEIEVLPQRLTLMVTQSWARRQRFEMEENDDFID